MLDGHHGLESKKWLSASERATIKSLDPYQGGDPAIWPLHQLDILRKHKRLITVSPGLSDAWMVRFAGVQGVRRTSVHFDQETAIFRIPTGSGFRPTPGNSNVTAEISFTETATMGSVREPVFPTLRKFTKRVREILRLFA
jgi:hypothetical protein